MNLGTRIPEFSKVDSSVKCYQIKEIQVSFKGCGTAARPDSKPLKHVKIVTVSLTSC